MTSKRVTPVASGVLASVAVEVCRRACVQDRAVCDLETVFSARLAGSWRFSSVSVVSAK